MKNYKIKDYQLALLASAFVVFTSWTIAGCGGGGGAASTTAAGIVATPVTTGTVEVLVQDVSDGKSIQDAYVQIGSSTVKTDASGQATLTGVASTYNQVIVKKTGYSTNYRPINVDQQGYALTVQLLSAQTIYFDPTVDNYGNLKNGYAEVDIYANNLVLVDAYGLTLPSGNIYSEIVPIDLSNGFQALPLPATTYNSIAGTYSQLDVYGAMGLSFSDSNRAPLFLKDGYSATIHVPIADMLVNAYSNNQSLPSTLPLYFFDDKYANWELGGTATLDSYAKAYVGTVKHFSVWLVGSIISLVTNIQGCVQDQNGNKLVNVEVNAQGDSYSYLGFSTAVTDSYGKFSVPVMKGSQSILTAIDHSTNPNLFSNANRFYDGTTTNPMTTCLTMGSNSSASNLQIKLSWGANPVDLDAHLTGPDGTGGRFSVYFNSPNYPSTATAVTSEVNLDVDTTTGFGPEIITIRTLRAGSYQYSVHQYNGTGTITLSPAKIEAVINGVPQIFNPPTTGWAGVNDVWQAFSFTVDQNGAVTTVTPLNTVVNNIIPDANFSFTTTAFGAIGRASVRGKQGFLNWPW